MLRFLLLIWAFLIAVDGAQAAGPMPKYLQDLERPYNAGDWTLQCNGSRYCQIIGVAKIPKDSVGVRAIVMINRDIAKQAKPFLRLAFVDSMGSLNVPAPHDGWRLYSQGLPRMPPPIKLSLGQPDHDGAYQTTSPVTSKLISAFERWPGSAIHDRGLKIITMPKGDLAQLMRKMDRLQHPQKSKMTGEEKAEWLKEYHYTIVRASISETVPPEEVMEACHIQPHVNQPKGYQLGHQHHLWITECREGIKVMLQKDGEKPTPFDVRDAQKKIHAHSYAGLNSDTSLLEITLPRGGQDGCGRRLKLGFTGTDFVMIEDRRYDRCRAVPYEFWPVVWHPTSWKYRAPLPSNEGNASPIIEGVKAL